MSGKERLARFGVAAVLLIGGISINSACRAENSSSTHSSEHSIERIGKNLFRVTSTGFSSLDVGIQEVAQRCHVLSGWAFPTDYSSMGRYGRVIAYLPVEDGNCYP